MNHRVAVAILAAAAVAAGAMALHTARLEEWAFAQTQRTVEVARIAPGVLRDTVAALEVSWIETCLGVRRPADGPCRPLLAWTRGDGGWSGPQPVGPFSVRPLALYDDFLVRGTLVEWYPVTRIEGEWLEVVADPVRDVRVWVRRFKPEAEVRDPLSGARSDPEVRLLDLDGDCSAAEPSCRFQLDLLVPEEALVVYPRPRAGSAGKPFEAAFARAYRQVRTDSRVEVAGEREGFARVIVASVWTDERAEVGWIPMRDRDGRLRIWIGYVSYC